MRFEPKDVASEKVIDHVNDYLAEALPDYDLVAVLRKSDYREDNYLYEVEAKNRIDGTYTVWTCWNESTMSLNHGHYGIESEKEAEKIMGMYHTPKRFDVGDRVVVFLYCEENNGTITEKDLDDPNFYWVDFDKEKEKPEYVGESDMEFAETYYES